MRFKAIVLAIVSFWPMQASEVFDLAPAIKSGAPDALAIAAQQASTDVGIERRCLDTQQRARFLRSQKLFAIHHDHVSASTNRRPTRDLRCTGLYRLYSVWPLLVSGAFPSSACVRSACVCIAGQYTA